MTPLYLYVGHCIPVYQVENSSTVIFSSSPQRAYRARSVGQYSTYEVPRFFAQYSNTDAAITLHCTCTITARLTQDDQPHLASLPPYTT